MKTAPVGTPLRGVRPNRVANENTDASERCPYPLRAIARLAVVFAALSAITHSASAQRTFSDAPAKFQPPPGVRFIADQQYREGSPIWRVDVALPEKPAAAALPTIVMVHGGGWSGGDKDGGRNQICHWAKRGYVGVTIRYRLLSEAPFPACIEDVKCAVRWLRAHARQFHVDPNRIGAFGHSAGAHLVAMLGVCPASAGLDTGPWPEQSSLVNAVGGVATPTDLLNGRELRRFEGATEEDRRALAKKCSPITYVSADAPPFLLVHGTTDGTVPPDNSTRFVAALREAGAKQVNLFMYDGRGHDPLPTHEFILRPMIDAFFDTTIGPRAGALQTADDVGTVWRSSRAAGAKEFSFDELKRFDRDGDGRVSLQEWPGAEELFSRLDQNETGAIEPEDLKGWRPRGAGGPAAKKK